MTRPRFSIGIDLGTTNCVLAFVPLAGDAASEVLPITQWEQTSALVERATLPSFLYLPEDAASERMRGKAADGGAWIAGQFARDRARDAPGRVAHSAKSWLCHHGVDREAALLPWGSRDIAAEAKISPVHASALILSYFRGAWNDRFAVLGADCAFDAQDITITVPASFDAAAQRLTLMAARQAGFPETVRLLEEPQAAFYTWLERHGGERDAWDELAGDIAPALVGGATTARHVLVVDIGGGTSDFSLFAVRPTGDAGAHIKRLAVSEHILLGGDNIDLALAHALEPGLSDGDAGFVGDQWDHLVARCRDLKERALSIPGPADENFQLSIPGRGSGLLAATRSARISRADIERIVLDGFFPACGANAGPRRGATALKEWGLPYATDSAITRHLADFLRARPAPDAILFNGGALYPEPPRRRIAEQIGRWIGRAPPLALNNDQPDLAVARGAARFGKLVHSGQARIEAGAARAIFLEAQSSPAGATAGNRDAGPVLICVLPRNAPPEKTFEIADLVMELRINRLVRFQAYSSTRHGDVEAGAVMTGGMEDLHLLPPLETIARVEPSAGGEARRTMPVSLSAKLSELGLLQIRCHATGSAERLSWPLEFNLRAHEQPDGAAATSPGGAPAAAPSGPNAPPEAMAAAGEAITGLFSRQYGGRDKLTTARVLQSLERTLKLAKGEWNSVLIRSLWTSLEACATERGQSLDHEESWLMLAGFLLRPGFGASGDEARIDALWRLNEPGLRFANKRVTLQAYILWRRVAGGLSRERQRAVLANELDKIRRQANPPPELIRMSGALERLDPATKDELIGLYIDRAAALARAGKHCAPYLAALGLLLNRAPLYAGPEDVVAPALVERAFEAFARLDWADAELSEMTALFLRAARVVDDRGLDVNKSLRARIASKLEKLGVSTARTARLRAHVPMAADERGGLFGEALPQGLILRER